MALNQVLKDWKQFFKSSLVFLKWQFGKCTKNKTVKVKEWKYFLDCF